MWKKNQGRNKGDAAEQYALAYLKQQGLTLITQNYHCRQGEIDLIMQTNETVVFVEVRLRKNNRFGSATESVTHAKQQKLIKTANHFLTTSNRHQQPCRFDVVGLTGNTFDKIEWIQDAFYQELL